jgi:hypothetical protein
MMLTIGTKDIHSGPFLQLMVLDKIVSATATGARRFFYDRERPLQQLQPHKIMPYSAPRWVKSNPCPARSYVDYCHAILEVIFAGNLSCRNAVLHKENFLPLPSNSDIPYSTIS